VIETNLRHRRQVGALGRACRRARRRSRSTASPEAIFSTMFSRSRRVPSGSAVALRFPGRDVDVPERVAPGGPLHPKRITASRGRSAARSRRALGVVLPGVEREGDRPHPGSSPPCAGHGAGVGHVVPRSPELIPRRRVRRRPLEELQSPRFTAVGRCPVDRQDVPDFPGAGAGRAWSARGDDALCRVGARRKVSNPRARRALEAPRSRG